MRITFVKKIKADGSPCRKCAEVQTRLEKDGYIDEVTRTVIADERDTDSEGMQLAKQYDFLSLKMKIKNRSFISFILNL